MQRPGMAWVLPLTAALIGSVAAPLASARRGDERHSLESLLERARERKLQAQTQLRGELDRLLAELMPANRTPTPTELSATVERLVRLGSEAAPLLMSYLDVQDGSTEAEKLRSREVASALSKLDTSAVTRELLSLLGAGGPDAKRNVLKVLAASPDADRVRPVVLELFRGADATLKPACMRTLLALGGGQDDALISEALAGADETLISMAIDALVTAHSPASADQMRRLLSDPRVSQRHAMSLMAYFRTAPGVATAADTQAFVRLAVNTSVAVETRVQLLDALAALRPPLNAELRKLLEPLSNSADKKLREGSLVLMTRLGDKSARKELLREFDELVERNERWSESWVRRADVLARLGDDEDAIKDYKQALVVARNDPSLNSDTWVKLARAYARRAKLKDAAETLRKSPLADAALKALADDPEFKALRDSKYGKDTFGLK